MDGAEQRGDGGVVDRLLVSGTMALSDASASAEAMACTPFTSLPTTGSMAATSQTGEESSSFMACAEDCRLEAFFAAVAKSCPAMAVWMPLTLESAVSAWDFTSFADSASAAP